MSSLEERSVIGCLLMDNGQIHKICDILKPEMFSDPLMRDIYREIVKAYDIGQPSNLVTITQAVECDTFPREHIGQMLKECALLPITSGEISSYADSLVKEYKARELKRLLSDIRVTAAGVNAQIADLLRELEALKKNEKSRARQLSAIVGEYRDQYFKEQTEDKLYTGFSKLDDITGGLEGGDMIVIGARPGVGKSAFISQIILEMAKKGNRIGFYNLEMSDKQVYERFLSNQSGIKLNRIRRAKRFLGDEQERFRKANDTLGRMIFLSAAAQSLYPKSVMNAAIKSLTVLLLTIYSL